MKRNFRRLIALVLVLALIPVVPMFTVYASQVTATGTVGINGAPWRLYNDGTLIVEEGRINQSGVLSPWDAYRANINHIIFEGPIDAGFSLRALFVHLTNLHTITGLEYFDTSRVTSMYATFHDTPNLTDLSGINNWDTGNLIVAARMFWQSGVTSLDLSAWDVGRVTNMSRMFQETDSLTMVITTGWNTQNVTNMANMFFYAEALTQLDANHWDTRNVTNMNGMFRNTISLTSLDLSGWDTRNVTNMSTMFRDGRDLMDNNGNTIPRVLTTLNISGWDTRNVTDMDRMFDGATALTALDVSNWDTRNVTNMRGVFQDVMTVSELDVSGWNTDNVTNMAGMFRNTGNVNLLDVSGWNTEHVTNMERMFEGAGVVTLNVSNWKTGNVTLMTSMFFNATALTGLDVSGWDTGGVTNMNHMFRNASSLSGVLDVSNWDVSRVTTMDRVFSGTGAVTTLDVSNWDTRSVTNMQGTFQNTGATILDVSQWDTRNVITMAGTFQGAGNVTTLDVSNWDTSNVTLMNGMFMGSGVTALDVSRWDTSNVTDMSTMFRYTRALTVLDVSDWDTSRVTNMGTMFMGTRLTALDLSRWNVNRVTSMNSMFRDANHLTALDLYGWNTTNVTNMSDFVRGTAALRRITFGSGFINNTNNNPNIPNRTTTAEFTGFWVNISEPGMVMIAPETFYVTSAQLLPNPQSTPPHTIPTAPPAPGIWVWQRQPQGVAMSIYPSHRFPTVPAGYAALDPHNVTVVNVGLEDIAVPLTITMTGDINDFTLAGDLYTNTFEIPAGLLYSDYFPFTIVPNHGLPAGDYSVRITVTGAGIPTEYFDIHFRVVPNLINDAVIIMDSVTFDGTYQTTSIRSVTLNGYTLVEGDDFEIIDSSWVNNRDAREATDANPPSVTIRGLDRFAAPTGEYSEAIGHFTILPRPLTVLSGTFALTKVYDGNNSSAPPETMQLSGTSLTISGLAPNDVNRLMITVDYSTRSAYSDTTVYTHAVVLLGLTLASNGSGGYHRNYILQTSSVSVPAHITPADLSPAPIQRNVEAGASRTINIPINYIYEHIISALTFGTPGDIDDPALFNYSAQNVTTTATIDGGYLVITTQAGKNIGDTETLTIRTITQNFGNVDVVIALTVIEAQVFDVTFDIGDGTHTGGGALFQTISPNGAATPPTATLENHTLTGWISDVTGMTYGEITGNVIFTAIWTPDQTTAPPTTPEETTPVETTPVETTPTETTPVETTPTETTPTETTPDETTPTETTPTETTPTETTPTETTPTETTPTETTPTETTPTETTPTETTPTETTPQETTPTETTPVETTPTETTPTETTPTETTPTETTPTETTPTETTPTETTPTETTPTETTPT
ncbi:MAG: BspA family leucine-rich repeat surface protein, partial [Defluviitaleaceae bacterium]|nr:BspA family leucine-rich repeat surface protein [Defluviitaleaceae bacterium]